jgi:cobalt/nickel transport system permease protein
MGCAALSGFAARVLFRGTYRFASAFLAGFFAIVSGAALVVCALVLSSQDLAATAVLIMAANIPLAVVEGVLTAFIVLFLMKTKPDVLGPA